MVRSIARHRFPPLTVNWFNEGSPWIDDNPEEVDG